MPRIHLIVIVIVALLTASTVHAALTTESCLAQKRKAAGNMQKCRAVEEAKQIQGKPADPARCATKFQEKLGRLSQKASDAGIACRYRDNGDDTVTDHDTGLQWEKKHSPDGMQSLSNPSDVDNRYSWTAAAAGTQPNGTVFADFFNQLNVCDSDGFEGFAGHCDWRLPLTEELQTIRLEPYPCATDPCIDPIFGPTASDHYWTWTTFRVMPVGAMVVNFTDGQALFADYKDALECVRAVRGGY